MNSSKLSGRNGAAVVGDDRHDRQQLSRLRINGALVDELVSEHRLIVGEGELDRRDRVVLVRSRRDVEPVLDLRVPIPAPAIHRVPPCMSRTR